MHEILHLIGLCSDGALHPKFLDMAVASWQTMPYINTKAIKYYVTKFTSTRRTAPNKR